MTETLPSMADEVDPQQLAEQLLAQAKMASMTTSPGAQWVATPPARPPTRR